MANKHTRDFGLPRNGAGKGDVPRTNLAGKEYQDGYNEIDWGLFGVGASAGYVKTGPAKWTKKFK